MGPKATTSPVFAAENTPASIRGGLVMSWQLWVSNSIYNSSEPQYIGTWTDRFWNSLGIVRQSYNLQHG